MPSRDYAEFDLLGLLDALGSVDLIVVGGVASSLHGGPRITADLDIVPARCDTNLVSLGTCLEELGAVVREPGDRRIPVTPHLLRQTLQGGKAGQLRTRTRLGPLDILWQLHDGRGYEELIDGSIVLADDERDLRVIGIDDLIDVKRQAGRPQDLDDVRYLKEVVKKSQA